MRKLFRNILELLNIKRTEKIQISGTGSSFVISGMTSIDPLEYHFGNIKTEIEYLSEDDKITMLNMINDEYKVLSRKEKLKKLI
jgi:hypothetical protein